jgi:hypothetical protein
MRFHSITKNRTRHDRSVANRLLTLWSYAGMSAFCGSCATFLNKGLGTLGEKITDTEKSGAGGGGGEGLEDPLPQPARKMTNRYAKLTMGILHFALIDFLQTANGTKRRVICGQRPQLAPKVRKRNVGRVSRERGSPGKPLNIAAPFA